uniref:Phosphatidylinositol-4-phosphate 3-kinase catalytic subunit type 2 gamma n=1 Tax=Crocodylus porosus TaxID=8502 RepID=A0A7M4F3J0_CROPO
MAHSWKLPLTQEELNEEQYEGQTSYSMYHFVPASQVSLGLDHIAGEVSSEMSFYGTSDSHGPEENDFFTSKVFDLNAAEQHFYGVNQPWVPGEFYFGSPVSPWQQTTGPPAVGFRPSLLPGCYNFSVEDSYPAYPLETYYNYDAYKRNSSSQIGGEFGSVVEENENKLNFHIGFEHTDGQYLMFSGDSPNGQGMNNRSGDARSPFPVSYGELAGWSIQLVEVDQGSNESTAFFCSAVKKIRDSCPAFDLKKNTGKIWSVATMVPNQILCKSKLRISILTNCSSQPLHLTPYGNGRFITECFCLSLYDFSSQHHQQKVDRVIEEVKAICSALSSVETRDITDAVEKLHSVPLGKEQVKNNIVTELSAAISHLIYIYSRSFDTNFQSAVIPSSPVCADVNLDSQLGFIIYAAHNIPEAWVKRVTFPLRIKSLPRETILAIKLYGVNYASQNTEVLAWTCCPLYPKQRLVHGTVLLSMALYNHLPTTMLAPGICNTSLPAPVTLQIDFPETKLDFIKPEPEEERNDLEEPTKECLKHIRQLSQKHSLLLLSEQKRRFLWFYRSYCNNENCSLPLVLGSAPSWDRKAISEMYAVLRDWRFSNPLEALGLLTFSFPDQDIRRTAVQQIENMSNDELLEYLPQLVQVIKFEWSLESPLVQFLLNRCLQSIQVTHQLYWLLKDAQNEAHFKGWYQKLLAALQFCAGKTLNDEFSKERKLIKILEGIAEKVKAATNPRRQEVLKMEINRLKQFFQEVNVCRLPLNPALVVQGIDSDTSSYFTSNAFPLKISFINADTASRNINVIFKMGDDLRQDMLVLQIIRVMDRIWIQEGLDMQMIIYRCLSTGKGQGLVQMVPDATTLAKIHRESGLIGPLKENTIKKWFSHHHPLELSYQEAVRNFFHSCAGWCVVTFILGVCDRHNDNIMLTNTGHMFHIDFGKFLGHAQKFGSIKRDRAPFIFTSEMEYFITEGGKNPQRFQEFVELCCRAYNTVRKHSQLLLNLLEMMLHAGLPELNSIQDLKYVHNNLRPQDSDLQATSYFTRKIKESLECFPVKLNNLIHTLAQMSLTGSAKPPPSDIVPQDAEVLNTESSIARATILGISKNSASLYLVQVVQTCNTATFVEKSFDQFSKLHGHLQKQFPWHSLPEFPHWWHLPFTDQEHKRMKDLNLYLKQLLSGPSKVANNEYVLSFFLDGSKNDTLEESSFVKLGPKSPGHKPGVQLVITYEGTRLTILLKHMRSIHLPDGSPPTAHAEFYLLPDPNEVSRRKTKAVPKSTDPTYNEIVVYDAVTELQGRVLKLVVKSKGTFLGAINIQLNSVQLNEEKWYPLGNSII